MAWPKGAGAAVLLEPEISGASLVLLGNLNPKIFTPAWFSRYGLITNEQADNAALEIAHPEVVQFKVPGLSVTVETEKFTLSTTEAPFVRLCDVAVTIFSELLPHTPLTKLGINREAHFNVGQQTRDKIGKLLAPPKAWGAWGQKISSGKGGQKGGMRDLTMEESNPEDRESGYIRVTVQPSLRIKDENGIFIAVNDHYSINDPDKVTGARNVLRYLEGKKFDESIKRSEELIEIVLRLKDAK